MNITSLYIAFKNGSVILMSSSLEQIEEILKKNKNHAYNGTFNIKYIEFTNDELVDYEKLFWKATDIKTVEVKNKAYRLVEDNILA